RASAWHAGGEPRSELIRGEPADELAVEPIQALKVRHRRTGLDLFDGKPCDQLLDRQDVFGGPGRPPEEGDEVIDRLRQITGIAVLEDVFCTVAFGQRFLVGTKDQLQMSKRP